jgi:polyhydroxybutyrate depolymerase
MMTGARSWPSLARRRRPAGGGRALALALTAALALAWCGVARAEGTLEMSPAKTVVGVDGTMRFMVSYDADGTGPVGQVYLDGSQLLWWTSDIDVLVVDQTGLAYGKAPGLATVTARWGTVTVSAEVRVAGAVSAHTLDTPDGRTRSYLLYVPESYAGAPTPLMLAFHGGHGGSSHAMMHVTQLNRVADKEGFIVAYPDGVDDGNGNLSWNAGGCCGWAAANGVDDVEFTRHLLDGIGALVNVDERRVYATGMSNGAAFVHRLGVDLADRIAGIAPVAGGLAPGGDFEPIGTKAVRAMPVIAFHGTTDQDSPYKPIPKVMIWWVYRDRIKLGSITKTFQKGIVTCYAFTSSAASVSLCTAKPPTPATVNGVVVDGGGHAWPGGVKANVAWADYPAKAIDASAAMWQFLKRYALP